MPDGRLNQRFATDARSGCGRHAPLELDAALRVGPIPPGDARCLSSVELIMPGAFSGKGKQHCVPVGDRSTSPYGYRRRSPRGNTFAWSSSISRHPRSDTSLSSGQAAADPAAAGVRLGYYSNRAPWAPNGHQEIPEQLNALRRASNRHPRIEPSRNSNSPGTPRVKDVPNDLHVLALFCALRVHGLGRNRLSR